LKLKKNIKNKNKNEKKNRKRLKNIMKDINNPNYYIDKWIGIIENQ